MNTLAVCYPKCSTCKKAMQWLDDHGIAYTYRDIVKENPTKEELTRWYKQSNLPLKRFFNTSGLVYKNEGMKDKLPTLSEEAQLELLAQNGMLVKRPIIVTGNLVLVGFRETEWAQTLL